MITISCSLISVVVISTLIIWAKSSGGSYLKEAGLPDIHFHDLRHSAATILLCMGVNVKVVQELLGHSDISITLGVYGHLLPSMQQTVVDTWDGVFAEKDEDGGKKV